MNDAAARKAWPELTFPTSPDQYGRICANVIPGSLWGARDGDGSAVEGRTIIAVYFPYDSGPPDGGADILVDGGAAFFRNADGTRTRMGELRDAEVITRNGVCRWVSGPSGEGKVAEFLVSPFVE